MFSPTTLLLDERFSQMCSILPITYSDGYNFFNAILFPPFLSPMIVEADDALEIFFDSK